MYEPTEASLLTSSHLIGKSKTAIYLVYENKPQGLWWQRFLKKGYKHVFAVRFDGFFWIKTEFTIGYLDCDVLPVHDRATIKTVLKHLDCTYQYVEAQRESRYRALFALFSCVEGMKAMLGIKAFWIITPYQLYKYCEAHHGSKEGNRANSRSGQSNKAKE